MSKHTTVGICRVCGQEKPLSFEHIPPRSLGNSHIALQYRMSDIVETHGVIDVSRTDGIKYEQLQRGTGVQTICKECNNYFGQNYVPEYIKFAKNLAYILANNPPKEEKQFIELAGSNINMLALFKHVISNFCATTAEGTMSDCKDFLLDKESNDFPSHYRLFAFAEPNTTARLQRTGWLTPFIESDGDIGWYTVASIAAFPVGFYLLDTAGSSITPSPKALGCELTSLSKLQWEAKTQFALQLPFMTLSKMLYMPKEHTKRDISNN